MTGIAKGAGMIRPDMATMLGFVATDARVSSPLVQQAVEHAAERSFNCITVDGDTSTNDSFVLIATGAAPTCARSPKHRARNIASFATPSPRSRHALAQAIVRDGEGATKFITVRVEGGATKASAARSRMRSRIRRS